ncbi:MAG: hypothetical protein IJA26_02195 [Clostridia bacterium]|nr:hypothetical protein [Clostridia bacterium]
MKKVFAVALIVLFVFTSTIAFCDERDFYWMTDEELIELREKIDIELALRGKETGNTVEAEESEDKGLDARLQELPIVIIDTEIVVNSENYKSLYPDELSVIIRNDSEEDIRDIVLAYVAWDKNNLPVKILQDWDIFSDATYLKEMYFRDINLIPGATFGEDNGFPLDSNYSVHSFKAIVVSYETFDNETWVNPYYKEFREMYEGKKLTQ